MNYRNLYDLMQKETAKLNKLLSEYDEGIGEYNDLYHDQMNIIKSHEETLFRKLTVDGFDALSMLTKLSDLSGQPLIESFSVVQSTLDSVQDAKDSLDTMDSIETIVALNEQIITEAKSIENDFESLEGKRTGGLGSFGVASQISDLQPSKEEIEKSQGLGFWGKAFSFGRTNQLNRLLLSLTNINEFENRNGDSLFSVNDDYMSIIDKNSAASLELTSLQKKYNDKQTEANSQSLLMKRFEQLTLTVKSFSSENLARETFNQSIKVLSKTDTLSAVYESFDMENSIVDIKKSTIRGDLALKIKAGLSEQKSVISKTIKNLQRNDSKLRRAKSRAGSKSVRGFNESQFNKSMSSMHKNYGTGLSWANNRRDRIYKEDIILDNPLATSLLMFALFSDDSDDLNTGGAMLLSDHLSEAQNTMPNLQGGLNDIGSVDGIDFSIDDINLSELAALSSISIPDIPEIPNVPDISFSDSSGGFGGGVFD
jgi:hypothetical protein